MAKKYKVAQTTRTSLAPMSGETFCRLRAAMGLSVRQMASLLGRSSFAIQHWGKIGLEDQAVLFALYYLASRGPLSMLEVANVDEWILEATTVGVGE